MNAASAARVHDIKTAVRGRTNKADMEAKRAETRQLLEGMGVLDEVAKIMSKKGQGSPSSWNSKQCEKALEIGTDLAAQTPAEEEAPVEVYETVVTHFVKGHCIDPGELCPMPYAFEVRIWEQLFAAEERLAQANLLLEIEREQMEAVMGPLKAITDDEFYRASMEDVLFVIGLDHGRPIRDLRAKARTIMADAANRDESGYKGQVKLVIKFNYDARPSDNQGAAYSIEVKEELPPFCSGGRLYHDAKGNLLKGDEVYAVLPLGKSGSIVVEA